MNALILLGLLGLLGQGVAAAQTSFRTEATGQTSLPANISITFLKTGTVASLQVLTLGMPNLDFTSSGSPGCSVGASYSKGQSCSVAVTFTPKYPGTRLGAVVLLDGSQNALGVQYLSGVGVGAVGVMMPGTIQTVAGTGQWTSVYDGQPAILADLDLPSSVALDGAGNMYIADSAHQRIRRVDANSGIISTVAGNGDAGYYGDGGLATNAQLNTPSGVAVDGAGDILIADSANNVVREIAAAGGVITTVAGPGSMGVLGDNGPATAATLNTPRGVTIAASGDLYIADTLDQRIRLVSASSGIITTVAGNGSTSSTGIGTYSGDGHSAISAGLNLPWAVVFDSSGNMYIPDSGNNVVRKVTSGNISTYAGNGTLGFAGDYGPANQANLYAPSGLACDAAGNVYVADTQNNRVRKVSSATGEIITIAGDGLEIYGGDGASATAAGLYGPYGLFLDGAGNLLISDYFDHRIREISSSHVILTYPAVREDQVSLPQTQFIENDGNAPLTIAAVTPDANAAVDSSSMTTCLVSGSLLVDASCKLSAEFAPTEVGNPVIGNIQITGNAADSPLNIEVIGQGLSVNATTVALISSASPSSYTQSVTFIATVATGTGVATGTVTFTDNGNALLNSVVTLKGAGTATYATPALTVGSHAIVGKYSGDVEHFPSTSPTFTQVVNQATGVTLVSSQNPSALNAGLTFTAVVTSKGGAVTPDGTVVFSDGATVLGASTLNASGVATFADAALAAGLHSITAAYSGDTAAYILGSTSTALTQDVQAQSTTQLSSGSNPSIYGNALVLTATVTSNGPAAAAGVVSFLEAGKVIGSTSLGAGGTAVLTISTLAAGSHSIVAMYASTPSDESSNSQPLNQLVQPATDVTAESYSPNPAIAGKSVTITAAVTVSQGAGAPTGQVSFRDGATALGTATLSGSGAAVVNQVLAPGTHGIVATYAGDANDGSSVSSVLTFTVQLATTAVAVSATPNPSIVESAITIKADVSGNGGTPSGSVTFFADGVSLGTQRLNGAGSATLTTSVLVVGSHALTATYSGDTDDTGSTSPPITEIVQAITTTTTLGSSTTSGDKPQLILAASVIGAAGSPVTGTVTFISGTNVLGIATLSASGSATLTPDINSGTITIFAVYSGDAVHLTSTSAPITVIAPGSGMDVTLTPASVTVATGQNATLSVLLTSTNGFVDQVGLGCASLPALVFCHFSSPSVDLKANTSQTLQLTIDTNSPLSGGTQSMNRSPGASRLAMAGLPFSALLGWVLWRGRRRYGAGWCVLLLVMATPSTLVLSGCGGISMNTAAPGTYTIQIVSTGTASDVTRSVNLTIIVTR